MIINTGQRTDIPAFYSEWFLNRIQEGYVMVRNPYYPSLVTKFSLDPNVVDCIGFCTKNPKPMLPYIDDLKNKYGMFWYITITAFDNDLEPNVPLIDDVILSTRELANKIGKNAIGWRYTPIIINEKYTLDYHVKTFEYIATKLENSVSVVAFGFLDMYDKLKRNHPEIIDTSDENKIFLAKKFKEIAVKHHLILRLCSKEKWLADYGIDVNGCMRLEDYERAINKKIKPTKKMNARNSFCSCLLSNDIGTYNSCLHLCTYCYANGKKETIFKNFKIHEKTSPFLIGNYLPNDKIQVAKQESWVVKDNKINLF